MKVNFSVYRHRKRVLELLLEGVSVFFSFGCDDFFVVCEMLSSSPSSLLSLSWSVDGCGCVVSFGACVEVVYRGLKSWERNDMVGLED